MRRVVIDFGKLDINVIYSDKVDDMETLYSDRHSFRHRFPKAIKRGTFGQDDVEEGVTVLVLITHKEDIKIAGYHRPCLIIRPEWVGEVDTEVRENSIPVSNLRELYTLLKIFDIQRHFFYRCASSSDLILALCSANYYFTDMNEREKSLIEEIEEYLKKGCGRREVQKALLWHILAGILHGPAFQDVDIWTYAPSSSQGPNPILETVIQGVCHALRRSPPDQQLFVRHTRVEKSQFMGRERRCSKQLELCKDHLYSINVNPAYRSKLKNKTVCIVDDYITLGTTFESLRNLLKACDVKRVILFAIGKFWTKSEHSWPTHKSLSFKITGDVYEAGRYQCEYVREEDSWAVFDEYARNEIINIAKVI
ncbi:uncharacterized protein LOC144441906 [Glandiceps talaboti]